MSIPLPYKRCKFQTVRVHKKTSVLLTTDIPDSDSAFGNQTAKECGPGPSGADFSGMKGPV